MTVMEHTDKVDDRRAQIIGAAIRRFSHFGIDKTSMSEVADDIKISKANLYYYFPDKWSLINAIGDTVIAESDQEIDKILERERGRGVEHLLLQVVEIKRAYFNKYKQLVQDLDEAHVRDSRFKELTDRIFEKERATTARILELGIQSGELVTMDLKATSELYTIVMRGLIMYSMYSSPAHFIEPASLDAVHEKQKEFVRIFVRGIIRK